MDGSALVYCNVIVITMPKIFIVQAPGFQQSLINLERHDTKHNDTQHNDTQHNDTQHNDTSLTTFSIMTFSTMTFSINKA